MPECTELERAVLDAMNKGENIYELRNQLAISRIPREIRDENVSAWARQMKACTEHEAAFKKLDQFGINWESRPGTEFYNAMRAEAEAMAGKL